MTHSLKWGKRLTAAAGVTALVAAGFAGTSFAATTPGVVADLASVGTPTLSIYKHEGNPSAMKTDENSNDGLAKTMPEGDKPMKGVVFSATPVQCAYGTGAKANVDLSTNAGWQMIQKLSLSVENNAVTLTGGTVDGQDVNCAENTAAAVTATTGENGWTGAWSGTLAKTVYVVREKSAPTTPTIVDKVKPFLVTLPLAYKDGGWIQDVKVYAKNQTSTDESTKTPGEITEKVYEVKQATSGTDSTAKTTINPAELTWTLSSIMPVAEDPYQSFAARDNLPKGMVFKKAEVAVTHNGTAVAGAWGLNITGCATGVACVFSGESTNATAAVAYNDKTGTDSNWDTASASLQFALTGPVNTLQAGDKVVITLTTAVDPTKLEGGALTAQNTYSFAVDDDWDNKIDVTKPADCPEGKTCVPTVNFGKIQITKVNAKNAESKLAGAKFKLYVVDDSGTATNVPDPEDASKTISVKLKAVDSETYTTAKDGVLELTVPLPAGDQTGDATRTYYVQETAAPDGFVTPTGAAAYTEAKFTAAGTKALTINNSQTTIDTIPAGLPITGAQGLMLLTLGGAAIVLVGVGSVMVIRRRQEQD